MNLSYRSRCSDFRNRCAFEVSFEWLFLRKCFPLSYLSDFDYVPLVLFVVRAQLIHSGLSDREDMFVSHLIIIIIIKLEVSTFSIAVIFSVAVCLMWLYHYILSAPCKHWICKIIVRYILPSVCLRMSRLCNIWGVSFQLTYFSCDGCENMCALSYYR